MTRALALAALVLAMPVTAVVQSTGTLRIKVAIAAPGSVTPVARHLLLISDDPPSAPPRRVVTAIDGTAVVNLRTGKYVVESDRPVVLDGKSYQWMQAIEVTAGQDTVLTLTADNAEVETAVSSPGAAAPVDADPASILLQWQDSVPAIWTPTTRASGLMVGAQGLVVTSQRVIGAATMLQVQLTPAVKVAAAVLAADPDRDVAVLRIDAKVAESVRTMPLPCTASAAAPVASGQRIFAVGAPLRQPKSINSASVMGTGVHTLLADLILPTGSVGGPVFTANGDLVGITSVTTEPAARSGIEARVVRLGDVCAVVASAEKDMKAAAAPSGARLPVEPAGSFPVEALKDAARNRTSSILEPYALSSSAFEVAFITPVLLWGAENRAQLPAAERTGTAAARKVATLVRPLSEFGNWSEYVAGLPPVLMIRVTPKMVEGFWTKVARAAARTQGASLPPIKRIAAGFAGMRAFCGEVEVTPIQPFRLEQRVGDAEAIYEGLYVFDPDALGPHCGTVRLVLYSDKDPRKGDSRVVDAKVVEQAWQDFAPYRALRTGPLRERPVPGK